MTCSVEPDVDQMRTVASLEADATRSPLQLKHTQSTMSECPANETNVGSFESANPNPNPEEERKSDESVQSLMVPSLLQVATRCESAGLKAAHMTRSLWTLRLLIKFKFKFKLQVSEPTRPELEGGFAGSNSMGV